VVDYSAIKRYSANAADPATLAGYRARGSFGAETAIGAGDYMLDINAWGSGAGGYVLGAQIRFIAEGTFDLGSGLGATRLEFHIDDGTGLGPLSRLSIASDGTIHAGVQTGVGTVLGVFESVSSLGAATSAVSAKIVMDDHQDRESLALGRRRADGVNPNAGFGVHISYWIDGADGSLVKCATINGVWENNQTNDTTDRDSSLLLYTMVDNTLTHRASLTSAGVLRGATDNVGDLGTSAIRWKDGYLVRLRAGLAGTGTGIINSAASALSTHLYMEQASATNTDGIIVNFSRARGSIGGESGISAGDNLAELRFHGYRSGAYVSGAQMQADAEGVTNTVAGRLTFHTRPDLAMGGVMTLRLAITSTGNVVIGDQAVALATTATTGFLHIPSCAGTPTGVPTLFTGAVPMVYDSTNFILYVYAGGAWRAH
jgi:hypothetical protein